MPNMHSRRYFILIFLDQTLERVQGLRGVLYTECSGGRKTLTDEDLLVLLLLFLLAVIHLGQ